MAKQQQLDTRIERDPSWDTWVRRITTDGRVVAHDNSVWLYRRVAMSPVVDAKTNELAVDAGGSLARAFDGLASLAGRGTNRRMSRSGYRTFHLLWLNVPYYFRAPSHMETAPMLNQHFRDRNTLRKELLLGVRLVPTTGTGGLRSAIDSVVESLQHGQAPMSDYDRDAERVGSILQHAGLEPIDAKTMRFAQSWWTHGEPRALPVLAHDEHVHYFSSIATKNRIEANENVANCADWWDAPGQFAVSYAAAQDFDLDLMNVSDLRARWLPKLADARARVVSVRGLVEPPTVTRQELRHHRRSVQGDIREGQSAGKDSRAEAEEQHQLLQMFEDAAATGAIPPTLVDLSMVVGFDSIVDEPDDLAPSTLRLSPMTNVQAAAWHETMVASAVRANPVLHDLSAHAIAYAGFQDISRLGDRDGALLGFTRDDQPVYVSPTAAHSSDSSPMLGVMAASGSGKTVLLQWLMYQWAKLGNPCVFIDPKAGSDLDALVDLTGGRVVSLDSLISTDGALDPLFTSEDPESAIQLATSMIGQTSPFGLGRFQEVEPNLLAALSYGVRRGARFTGEALRIATEDGQIDPSLTDPIFHVADTVPMFRATFGSGSYEGEPISVSRGITLFKAGRNGFQLPGVGEELDKQPLVVRASVNLLRMLVRSSMEALRRRNGVLGMDEAWVLEKAAPGELVEIGRLARSAGVLPVYMTQTPSGPVNMGLTGYFSRGLIGHISDPVEARAGTGMFAIDSPALNARVSTPRHIPGGRGLNPGSLRALVRQEPDGTLTLVRSTQFIYSDIEGSVGAVTVDVPAPLLKAFSTTPEEVERRRLEQEAARAAEALA